MKGKKSILLIILVLIVSIISTGCAKKISEKIGTEVGEKILEKALGDDVKVDSKDDKVSITTKDGSLQVGSDLNWPTDEMKPLPKPKAQVVSISDFGAEKSISVTINFSDSKGPREYLQAIKDLGYIETSMSESEDFFSFMGYKEDNTQVMIFSQESGEGTVISLTKDSESARQFFESAKEEVIELDLTDVDMKDEVPWPKDQMDKIPELEGKIINVTTSKEYVIIELEYVSKDDAIEFIKTVKNLGFNVNNGEVKAIDSISFMGQNDKDYSISINWYGTGTTINYTKP